MILLIMSSLTAIIALFAIVVRVIHNRKTRPYGISWADYKILNQTEKGRQTLQDRLISRAKVAVAEEEKQASDIKAEVIKKDKRNLREDKKLEHAKAARKKPADSEATEAHPDQKSDAEKDSKTNGSLKRHGAESKAFWFSFLIVAPPLVTYLISALAIKLVFLIFATKISLADIIFSSSPVPLLFLVMAILTGDFFRQIPQNHVWLISVFGKYRFFLRAGLNFLPHYIFFPILTVKEIYLGEKMLRIEMSDADTTTKYNNVMFKDMSAPVDMIIFYLHLSEEENLGDGYLYGFERSAFKVTDIVKAITEVCDSDARSWLGQNTLDEANRGKSKIIPSRTIVSKPEDIPILFDETVEALRQWGILVTKVTIADIDLPPELEEMRNEVLRAEKEAEKALFTAKATVTISEAEGKRLENKGAGYTKQVSDLKNLGVDAQYALTAVTALNIEEMKWNNAGTKGATVIAEGQNNFSAAAFGASFGAGMKNRPTNMRR